MDVDTRGGAVRRLLGEAGEVGVVLGTAPGTLLVGQTPDGAADEDVVDGVPALPSCLGRHISGDSFIVSMESSLLWSVFTLPGHVVPVTVAELFQPIQ